MNPKPLLTRKDIAVLMVDVTPDQVRRNERRWGLHVARKDLNRRCVRYRSIIAMAILRKRGFIE